MKKIAIIGSNDGIYDFIKILLLNKKYSTRNFILCIDNLTEIEKYKLLGIKITDDPILAVKNAHMVLLADSSFRIRDFIFLLNYKTQIILNFTSNIDAKKIVSKTSVSSSFNIVTNANLYKQGSSIFISTYCKDKFILKEVTEFLTILGKVIFIDNDLIENAYTLNNCASSFLMRFIRSMSIGGVQIGLDRKISNDIIIEIIRGTLAMIDSGNEHLEEEIDKLCSTEVGLIGGINELEHYGFSYSILKGIVATKEGLPHLNQEEKFGNEITMMNF